MRSPGSSHTSSDESAKSYGFQDASDRPTEQPASGYQSPIHCPKTPPTLTSRSKQQRSSTIAVPAKAGRHQKHHFISSPISPCVMIKSRARNKAHTVKYAESALPSKSHVLFLDADSKVKRKDKRSNCRKNRRKIDMFSPCLLTRFKLRKTVETAR
ncbi:hypothetical protein FE257_002704 [Aspergillus nanangensis]|uniref:Uncharacterized protein n=1 Tax=Aspergillus nanangensis TaxID=2582783 RepID=A0AAD4CCC6_ASPNN|nr:hypothetical protein FE257_002704 [Aspergillus nanangensis]